MSNDDLFNELSSKSTSKADTMDAGPLKYQVRCQPMEFKPHQFQSLAELYSTRYCETLKNPYSK